MATSKDTRFRKFRARIRRLGYELLRDAFDRMYILDPTNEQLIAVGLDSDEDVEREIGALKELADDDVSPAIRRAVKRVVKAYADGGQDCTIEFDRALAQLEKAVRAGGAA